MAFIFYDTETTGLETAFDQILQFAAIKTDDDLNELDRFDIRCRLMPHMVPSPGALRVTGVTPAMLTNPNFPSHYEATCQISQIGHVLHNKAVLRGAGLTFIRVADDVLDLARGFTH